MKMETPTRLYSLNYNNVKTYLFALLFVAGNIALPQLCHLVPYDGPTLLPVYFFTLIAVHRYGFRVGLLTAVLFPVTNHVLFAMPSEAVLLIILIKSTLLAGASTLAARTVKTVSLLTVLGVILPYQLIGIVFKWTIEGDPHIAVQDFRIGVPGMPIQWSDGYVLLKAITKL